MPDSTPYTWPQVVRDAIGVLQIVVLAYLAGQSHSNVGRIEAVQTQVDTKAEEISVKQDHAAKKASEVKATLDARTKEDIRVHGVSLYSSWKYLEDVAASTEKPADIAAANEARKAYMDHLKKYDHGGKQP